MNNQASGSDSLEQEEISQFFVLWLRKLGKRVMSRTWGVRGGGRFGTFGYAGKIP